MENDIVISGISGRFPESTNVDEFWENLVNGVDMVTQDDRRWPQGYAGVPNRKGVLKNSLEDFDAEFFRLTPKVVERLDPQLRQLLEVSWESVLDAGVNPDELAGRPIGVFVGASSQETLHACRYTTPTVSKFDITGSATCMFANRLSYAFNIHGPSFPVDTYCSSSLLALHEAVAAIRNGECEGAIVAGINLLLNPLLTLQVKVAGALSEDGKCKSFDASGDGYVRSEAIVSIFITKRSRARRSYATVVHTKTNHDGYKENGITFPSAAVQTKLMGEAYAEAGIDPMDVFYVEAHGTGTSAGDGQELEAISSIFCEGRTADSPLLIGSTKSNMGHAEAASSLCAVVKVLLSIQRGVFPGNLHYHNPNPDIPALVDGRLKVVTEVTKVKDVSGTIGVCASGIGGANVHVILKFESSTQLNHPSHLPVLIPFSSRTRQGVKQPLEKLVRDPDMGRIEHLRRIHDQRINSLEFRGFASCNPTGNLEVLNAIESLGSATPPLWLVFPGMGTQWAGMAKEIMSIDVIRNSIEESASILKPFGLDLIHLLVNETFEGMQRFLGVGFAAMGIALVDFVKSLNLTPDGFIGHSSGEWVCAYADGCWTRSEFILCQYRRDLMMNEELEGNYGMASVGLTWEGALAHCPPSIYPACHNSADNVTLTGNLKELKQFMEQLKAKGIFAKEVPTGGVPYHSPYLAHVAPKFVATVREVIGEGQRARSPRWISTSVPEAEWDTPAGKFFSPNYVVNNFISPVLFHPVVSRIPPNAVVLEVGSHSLFVNILKRALPATVAIIPMMKRDTDDNLKRIYGAVGSLFAHGLQPRMTSLYPPIGTNELLAASSKSSFSSLVEWNHSLKHPLLNYLNNSGGDHVTKVSLNEEEWEYMKGHQIDGRIIFPGTGYLVLAWKCLGTILGIPWNSLAVQFENVSFHRATILDPDTPVEFSVKIFENSGDFQICESSDVVASGKIQQHEELAEAKTPSNPSRSEFILNRDDLYKDLRLRGYEYSGSFIGMVSCTLSGDAARVVWDPEWPSFLDTVLQLKLVSLPLWSTGVYLPTGFGKVTIDPTPFLNMVKGELVHVSDSLGRKSVSAHGITFENIKFAIPERRRTAQIAPLLQQLEFVPYDGEIQRIRDFGESLKILVDIALENIPRRILRVNEILTSANESILSAMHEIIQCSIQLKMVSTQGEGPSDLVFCHNRNDFEEFVFPDKGMVEGNEFILVVSESRIDLKKIRFLEFGVNSHNTRRIHPPLSENPETVQSETVIEISNSSFNWLTPLQEALATVTPSSRIWLVTSEPVSGIGGLVNCLRKEFGGEAIRCLMSPQPELTDQLRMTDLVMNVNDRNGNLGSYRSIKFSQQPTTISEHAFLNVIHKGDLSSVAWIQAPPPPYLPRRDKILCTVYYAPLNFRDIIIAVGKLSPDALARDVGRSECVYGMEFVGTDPKGGRVMGLVPSKGLATHVQADPLLTWMLPEHWSMAEAATIPMAYSTAYYALIIRGRLQKGNSILITSGTGGVGQAAIAVAQSLDCEIFTTVGSEAKKRWLLERFPKMKPDHILSSQSTLFATEILLLTANRGVDIVLNSLAAEKLQAALTTVAIDGKFLEIGKFDLFQNTPLGMSILLRNISIHGILLDSIFCDLKEVEEAKRELKQLLADGMQAGVVQPLQLTIFEHSQAEEALRFMASGKHMGKVVLRMRSEDSAIPTTLACLPRTYFDSSKVYVLIGGLGGFGLEMASWMISRGVKILVLGSRSGFTNGYQELQVGRWRAAGVKVHVSTTEMDSFAKVDAEVQEWIKLLGPIGGFFNLAMVLRDGFIENQSPSDFEVVMKPKFVLTSVLDKVTRKLCPDLDHFVGFSSVSSVAGNEGQSNYGLGNSAIERICEQRRRDGFPGLAIAWGAIGDVGVVYEHMRAGATLVSGTVPQPLTSCLQVLDAFLHSQSKGVSPILSTILLPKGDEGTMEIGSGNSEMTLRQKMGRVLGLTEEGFEKKKELTLGELGLDSLMMSQAKKILAGWNGGQSLSLAEIRKLTWVTLGELEVKCC